MAKTLPRTVHDLLGGFPETECTESHGSPTWRVAGRAFATFTVNHHGDGRVALLLRMPPGRGSELLRALPTLAFVPPYSGSRGWIGLELNDPATDWGRVVEYVAEAWRHAAPAALADRLDRLPSVQRPAPLTPEEIDPFLSKAGRALLEHLDGIAGTYPETVRGEQFGEPCWKAGKRTFCVAVHGTDGFAVQTWAGPDRQALLADAPGYRIPPYRGANGWIQRAVPVPDEELEGLLEASWRHFALVRMVKARDAGAPRP